MNKPTVKSREEKSDICFAWSYALCLCVEPVRYLLSLVGITDGVATILTLAIVYLPMMWGFVLRRSIKLDFPILLFLVFAVFGVTLLLFPEYKTVIFSDDYYYSAVSQILTPFGGIFMFLFARNIKDASNAVRPFLVAMAVVFVYDTMQVVSSGGEWINEVTGTVTYYDMSLGYNLLFPVLAFYTLGLRRKKVLPIAIAVIGTAEILLYGSRTAILVIVAYFVLYFLWIWLPKNNSNKLWFAFGAVALFIILLVFGETLWYGTLSDLSEFFSSHGLSSRTLATLLNSSNRTEDRITSIWPNTIKLIVQSFGLGQGVYADHYHLGIFCHNFILEILLDFGIFIGGAFLVYIFKAVWFVLKKCTDEIWKSFFLIVIPFWLIRLMFSSSFWYEGMFWTFLATVKAYKDYKYNRQNRGVSSCESRPCKS